MCALRYVYVEVKALDRALFAQLELNPAHQRLISRFIEQHSALRKNASEKASQVINCFFQ